MAAQYIFLSIIFVGSGLSEPDMWPDLFGKWSDAYTVRKFWGRTWHQYARRVVSTIGKYLAQRVFRLPSGTNLSSYTQLYTAFLITGIIHSPPFDVRPLRFFLAQAVGITFEDAVIALTTKAGLRNSSLYRRLGYIWVYCWFAYSIAPWVDSLNESKLNDFDGQTISLTMGLYKNNWYPKRCDR